MRIQVLRTVWRVSVKILTQPLPLYREGMESVQKKDGMEEYMKQVTLHLIIQAAMTQAIAKEMKSNLTTLFPILYNQQNEESSLPFNPIAGAASFRCSKCNIGRLNYNYESCGARFFSSRDHSDQSDMDPRVLDSRDKSEKSEIDELSGDDTSDSIYSDHEIFEAFQSELTLDGDGEEKQAKTSQRGTHPDRLSQEEPCKDEQEKKPWNRKERVKACLDKLQRGPDGRYINVLEVASEVDMLIASYLKLRYQDDPSLVENSDEDEKLLKGIDIEKFKRLSKRMRDGTYEFQPIVQVPLPKKKIVKRKKKKLKK